MRDNCDLSKMLSTRILLRGLSSQGRELWRQTTHNQPTNAFATMLMTAWLRSGPSQVAYLYARFGDLGSNPGILAPVGGDLKQAVRADFLKTPAENSILGGLWVPLLAAPAQNSTDSSLYVGNQCTFYFRIPAALSSLQISPAANFNPATSYVTTLGLAVAPNMSDRTQDSIVTVSTDFDPFLVPDGGQIAVDYACAISICKAPL